MVEFPGLTTQLENPYQFDFQKMLDRRHEALAHRLADWQQYIKSFRDGGDINRLNKLGKEIGNLHQRNLDVNDCLVRYVEQEKKWLIEIEEIRERAKEAKQNDDCAVVQAFFQRESSLTYE